MIFYDRARIHVKAGDGGRGCVAFRRERGVEWGGPNGGDGGRGGHVVLMADPHLRTLIDFQYRPLVEGKRGVHGKGSQMTGPDSEDQIVRVPPGTLIKDADTGRVVGDLTTPGQTVLVAKGGKGGRGNQHFTTPTRQAPDWAEPGEPGESRSLELELRVLADVGLVGLPNAGKSSLLTKISAARPKVADYPFTTKEPHLGVVSLGRDESFVVADLPGLIEGAHRGVGLGHEFLRHISRTKVILHVVDVGFEKPDKEMFHDYDLILEELRLHDAVLLDRPRILVGNKCDQPGAEVRFRKLAAYAKKKGVKEAWPISALTGEGVPRLVRAMQKAVADAPTPELHIEEPPAILSPKPVQRLKVVRDQRGAFLVRDRKLEKLIAGADLKSKSHMRRLQGELTRMGVDEALVRAGVKKGDFVRIGALEFQYVP